MMKWAPVGAPPAPLVHPAASPRTLSVEVGFPECARTNSIIVEIASGHYFSQHRADFSVQDDIRPAVHVSWLAVDNRDCGALRLCNHR